MFVPAYVFCPPIWIPRPRRNFGSGVTVTSINVNNSTTVECETFVFTQAVPAVTWTINHNLNEFPTVTLVDGAGRAMIAAYRYVNSNQVIVTFSQPVAGKAYLTV